MTILRLSAIGVLCAALFTPTAFAQLTCEDIEFSDAVIEQFPRVQEACRAVVSRNGQDYVQVRADVLSVRRNTRDTSDVQRVTLRVLDAEDEPLDEFSFRPGRDFRYKVDDEWKTADSMGRGQELRIYIPPDRWEMVWDLETAVPFEEKIFVEDVESYASVMMLETDEAFDFDSDTLSESGKAQLDEILTKAGEYVPLIDIIGYTDRIGDEDYNLRLSQRRANAARDYLLSQGVPESRVRAMGKGATDPIVSCEGRSGEELKACLAPNRRAEVRFLVPMMAEGGLVEVTRRYRRPDGEVVEVTEYENVVGISSTSSLFGEILDACETEIADFCAGIPAGEGGILSCLYENATGLSDGCTTALSDSAVQLARRQEQLNLIGEVCASDLAEHCQLVPLVDKVQCLREADVEPACAAAVANLRPLN